MATTTTSYSKRAVKPAHDEHASEAAVQEAQRGQSRRAPAREGGGCQHKQYKEKRKRKKEKRKQTRAVSYDGTRRRRRDRPPLVFESERGPSCTWERGRGRASARTREKREKRDEPERNERNQNQKRQERRQERRQRRGGSGEATLEEGKRGANEGERGWGKTPSSSPATKAHAGRMNATRDGGKRGQTREGRSLRGENGQQNDGRERKKNEKNERK
jgi:hypothetical protein